MLYTSWGKNCLAWWPKGKTIILFLFLFVFIYPVTAQNTLVISTLNKAKQLRNENKLTQAAAVLGAFEKKYPGNLWIEQLYAQTLFWLKKDNEAAVVYKRAIGFHPYNLDLKYDYAVMLFSENKFEEAKEQLLVYAKKKNNNANVEKLLGKIFFYQSQFKKAEKYLGRSVQLNPDDKETENLYREVFRIVSPQLSLASGYINDDQPMQSVGGALKFQWYASDFLDFDLSGNVFNYLNIPKPGLIYTAQIGNRFTLRKAGLKLRLAGAWFYAGANQARDWGGTIALDKEFGKLFSFALEAERTSYTYTIASVNNNLLMMNQYSMNLSVGKTDSWNGKAGARYQFFPDNNYVSALYAWFLSRPLNFSGFKISFGYAFNYMNSKEDRFQPKTSAIPLYSSGGQNSEKSIEGVYVPYYTPHHQYANSVLVNFHFDVAKHADFYGHASVGVFSKTYAPGYYLLSGSGTPEEIFAYQKYTPLDLGLDFQADISKKAAVSLSYSFLQTYYYNSHNVKVVFRFYF